MVDLEEHRKERAFKVGFYMDLPLADDLYSPLQRKGIDVVINEGCLCTGDIPQDVSDMVIHPHETSMDCWGKMKNAIGQNPDIHFFLLTLFSTDREHYFGHPPNLTYVNMSTQLSGFVRYMESGKRENADMFGRNG